MTCLTRRVSVKKILINVDLFSIKTYYIDMNSRNKISRAIMSLFIASLLLASAAPQAKVVCACHDSDVFSVKTVPTGCGGTCSMEQAPVADDHPAGCDCEDCNHVELSAPDVQLFFPATFSLEHRENVESTVDVLVTGDDSSADIQSAYTFDTENRFTHHILQQLSTAVMIC